MTDSQLEKFCGVLRNVERDYARVCWSPPDIFGKFGRRSVKEIVDSKSTHYLCCVERNLLVARQAYEQGIIPELAMARIKRPLQPVKIGTALNLNLDGENYTFCGAVGGNILQKGRYSKNCRPEWNFWAEMDGDENKNWFNFFGINDSAGLKWFAPDFNLRLYLLGIALRNSGWDLKRTQAKIQRRGLRIM